MRRQHPLPLDRRKYWAKKLYQQYVAWGDTEKRNGKHIAAEHYYQHAEHCLNLIKGTDLQVIHGSAIFTERQEGKATPLKKHNLRVIQGGLAYSHEGPTSRKNEELPLKDPFHDEATDERFALYRRIGSTARRHSSSVKKMTKWLRPPCEEEGHPESKD